MISFRELSQKFLTWSKDHQAHRSWEYYKNYLDMFCAFPGVAETPAMNLKPYQVQEWIDSHKDAWGNNYKAGAVVAIKRMFNWAESMGYIDANPINKMKREQVSPRKIYMKPENYEKILSCLETGDPFRELLRFVWITGCRPQEVRHIEPRHVNLENSYILFPKEESKGKKKARKILLNDEAKNIIINAMSNRVEGKVFLNTRGMPWTKHSICNRMYRLSKQIGMRMFMYAARHCYATRKLKAKHGHLEIAATMGHSDGTMLAKVYSHIDEEDEHLRLVLAD